MVLEAAVAQLVVKFGAAMAPSALHDAEHIVAPLSDAGDSNVAYAGSHWTLLHLARTSSTLTLYDSAPDPKTGATKPRASRGLFVGRGSPGAAALAGL